MQWGVCSITPITGVCIAAGQLVIDGLAIGIGYLALTHDSGDDALPEDGASAEECDTTEDEECPPCGTLSGRFVPAGTIAFRPLDVVSDNVTQHGVTGSYYDIYKANQNPNNCQCFWQPVGAVTPAQLPPGAIPIEPFAI